MFKLSPRAKESLRREIERRFGADVWTDFAGDLLAARVDTPALVFHDETDTQVDISDAIALVKAWKDARLVRTSGLGHQKIVRDPEVISTTVRFMGSGSLHEPVDPFLTAATARA
jgi:pimeloyl-ACP methyl ester carboxylesterase